MDTNSEKESYLVEGMSCSGCERAIQKVVNNLEGVESANADLQTSTLSVEYNPERVNIEQIKSAVNKIGYRIVGKRPAFGQKEGPDNAGS